MKTILAIDDALIVRDLISFLLGNAGYNVVVANDGIAGIELLGNIKPDLILVDVNMPRLDGFGFLELARTTPNGANVPILFLTAESDSHIKTRAQTSAANGWIVKPFNPVQLIEAVRSVLSRECPDEQASYHSV